MSSKQHLDPESAKKLAESLDGRAPVREITEDDLDHLSEVIGAPRNPDQLSTHLTRLFDKADRRRVTFGVLAGVGVLLLGLLTYWTASNDAGLGSSNSQITLTDNSEEFEAGSSGEPSLSPDLTAASAFLLNEAVVVEDGEGDPASRIVVNPTDEQLPAPPGSIGAALVVFRGQPAVAVASGPDWHEDLCITATSRDGSGAPLRTVWVSGSIGSCTDVAGDGTAPLCAGEALVVLELRDYPAPAGEATAVTGGVAIELHRSVEDLETSLLTGAGTSDISPQDWPSIVGAPGDTVELDFQPTSIGGGQVACTIA